MLRIPSPMVSEAIRQEIAPDAAIIYDIYAQQRGLNRLPDGMNIVRQSAILAAFFEQEAEFQWPANLDAEMAIRGINTAYATKPRRMRNWLVVHSLATTNEHAPTARTVPQIVNAFRIATERSLED